MRFAIPILFWLLAVIHIIPALSGIFPARMAALYGLSSADKTLTTILQHRAVLFGIVGAACIFAAHQPSVRWPVLIGTIVSMASFILMALARGQMNGPLAKIAYVDGLGLLFAAIIAALLLRT